MNLRVTHYVRRSVDRDSWLPLTFVTRPSGSEYGPFFLGFEFNRHISREEVDGRLGSGTVKALEWSQPISENQGLWLSPNGDIWLASATDPIGDPAKLMVDRGDFPLEKSSLLLRINSSEWLNSEVLEQVFSTGKFSWFRGDYLNSKENPNQTYDPLWERRLRLSVLEGLRKIAINCRIQREITEFHLEEKEHRYPHIEKLIDKGNVALPLEIIFETSARRNSIRVIHLANVEYLALAFHRDGTAGRQLALKEAEEYLGDSGDWLAPIKGSQLKVCVPTYTSADHYVEDAIAYGRLDVEQKSEEPNIRSLSVWLDENRDDGILVCDIGIAHQVSARMEGSACFSLAKYEEPIPAGLAYKASDAVWGQYLNARVREVLGSEEERVQASLKDTIRRCGDLGMKWVGNMEEDSPTESLWTTSV